MKHIIFACLFFAAAPFAAAQSANMSGNLQTPGQGTRYVYDTSLMRAVKAQDADSVKTLLRARINPNEKNYEGVSPLYKAAELGNLEIVQLLAAAGAVINDPCKYGITPLMAASAGGHSDAVKFLLENRADVNARDTLGKNAILHAGSGGDALTIKYLLQADANIEDKDKYGETPLVIALKAKNDAGAADLITRGANLSAVSAEGKTAQVLARSFGPKSLVKRALDKRQKQEEKGTFNPPSEPVIIRSGGSSAAIPVQGTPAKAVVYGAPGEGMQTNTDTQNFARPAPGLVIEHK